MIDTQEYERLLKLNATNERNLAYLAADQARLRRLVKSLEKKNTQLEMKIDSIIGIAQKGR